MPNSNSYAGGTMTIKNRKSVSRSNTKSPSNSESVADKNFINNLTKTTSNRYQKITVIYYITN